VRKSIRWFEATDPSAATDTSAADTLGATIDTAAATTEATDTPGAAADTSAATTATPGAATIQSRNGENATPILQRNGVLGVGPPGCGGSVGEEHAFEVPLARLNGKFPTAP
jgi:hypothetical protein